MKNCSTRSDIKVRFAVGGSGGKDAVDNQGVTARLCGRLQCHMPGLAGIQPVLSARRWHHQAILFPGDSRAAAMGPVIAGHREQIRLGRGGRDVLTKAFQRVGQRSRGSPRAAGCSKPDGVARRDFGVIGGGSCCGTFGPVRPARPPFRFIVEHDDPMLG
jgi:hypothetical protein